jgi:hypothetical protein
VDQVRWSSLHARGRLPPGQLSSCPTNHQPQPPTVQPHPNNPSAFMLVGAKHKATVGGVEAAHAAEVSALLDELLDAGSAALGVPRAPGAVERLMAYARSVAHFPTAVKEVRVWLAVWRCAGGPPCGREGLRAASKLCRWLLEGLWLVFLTMAMSTLPPQPILPAAV